MSVRGLRPVTSNTMSTVIESGPRSERAFDIFSLLLKERIVFLGCCGQTFSLSELAEHQRSLNSQFRSFAPRLAEVGLGAAHGPQIGLVLSLIVAGCLADEVVNFVLYEQFWVFERGGFDEFFHGGVPQRILGSLFEVGAEVGFEVFIPLNGTGKLHLLIEKDFPCKDRPEEDQSDFFQDLADKSPVVC